MRTNGVARFTTGEHSPGCSGCPACREQLARLLSATGDDVAPPPSLGTAIKEREDRMASLRTGRRLVLRPVEPPTQTSESELRDAEQDEEIPAPPSLADALAARTR